jgi:hypothetical protein
MLTLTQAAVEVDRTRSTLFKAIKAGRLSATKDAQGNWLIDPVELHRVYVAANVSQGNKSEQRDIVSEIVFLRRENELLRQQAERDRQQIERERDQADHWRNQATMLLTHQPKENHQPEQVTPTGSRLFEKLFGRK